MPALPFTDVSIFIFPMTSNNEGITADRQIGGSF